MADHEPSSPDEDAYDLEDLSQDGEDSGLTLHALSAAYAELIAGGARRSAPDAESPAPPEEEADEETPADSHCEVTPTSILEALLFVGNPQNDPLTSAQVALLIRGVRPEEVDQQVRQLNERYQNEGCPYRIVPRGSGYLMQLLDDYARLRDKFYGRVREARLSQAAVDILAIVAYRQPMTRDEIDQLRGRPSGGVLTQLVRRQLLRIERPADAPRKVRYHTTDRFLRLFGLESLAELPQTHELDRNF